MYQQPQQMANQPNYMNNTPQMNLANQQQFQQGYPQSNQNINMQGQFGQQMGPPQVDPFMPINQSIGQGYGQFFFNMNDPNISKTNAPIKKDASMHVAIILSTLLLIGAVVGGAILLKSGAQNFGGGVALLVGGYILYSIVSICCSDIRGYITNLKKFENYKETYDKMVVGKGYFHFWIECYHYKTVRTKNGTRRQKVVTHTASQNYFPRESIDQSGNVTGINDLRKYVFVNYLKRFYFTDSASQQTFNNVYNNFIARNRRDQYQNYSQTFQIQGFEPEVGFCQMGDSAHNSVIYFVFTLIGLALPYSFVLQRSVSRYAINILKRLTC